MYGNTIIQIERIQNGFTVDINDPAVVKKNRERKTSDKDCTPWQDPKVTYSFETAAAVSKFIEENLEKAIPEDEYSSTFDKAAKDLQDD